MFGHIIGQLASFQTVFFMNLGLAAGIVIGALPGLTATMGIALFLPLTYGLDPAVGMFLLLGIYCGGTYGASITAILINTPGTPAAAATVLDGYPLSKQGRAGEALSMALVASTIAGLISTSVLLLVAPQIARFALRIGPAEYFSLAVFGLAIISSVSGKSLIKGLLMGTLGMLVSIVGLDPMGGIDRLTFGYFYLAGGLNVIPIMIGMFAVSELMLKCEDILVPTSSLGRVLKSRLSAADVIRNLKTIVKSSFIGTFIGAVPGTGSALAAFISYNEAKRSSRRRDNFGKGELEGVAASEAGNNGVTGATLIPLLTLGIPGDTVTAVMLGALMLHGITPGPQLFVRQREWVFLIITGLFVINLFMYLQGRVFIRAFVNVTRVPVKVLVPILFVLCLIGAFAINNTLFDVWVMLAFGLIAFVLKKLDFPMPPLIIAIILGPMAESNLRRALIISDGSLMTFVSKPISAVFLALSIITFLSPVYFRIRSRSSAPVPSDRVSK